jgi:hypothetical protein
MKDIKIGDYVQWEPNGVIFFIKPRRVTGLSPCKQYVFVEGSNTGLPIKEIQKEFLNERNDS